MPDRDKPDHERPGRPDKPGRPDDKPPRPKPKPKPKPDKGRTYG